MSKAAEPIWRSIVQGVLIGLVGAIALFGTELLLFPDLVRAAVFVGVPSAP